MLLLTDIQIVLLDFDGLLVSTEHLHFQAYQRMCQKRGFILPWDFARFCAVAHKSSTGLKETIYKELPGLYQQEPVWDVLYLEKKTEYKELVIQGHVELMPGVEQFLKLLEEKNMKRAVVTHSPKEQIDLIKGQIPLLSSIPLWITREDYTDPKPAPDGYLRALELLAGPADRVIGFEDTWRGYQALVASGVPGVVVSNVLDPAFEEQLLSVGAPVMHSFYDVLSRA
jgi:HAD superfamily hydrolase (TIGR01509 family)